MLIKRQRQDGAILFISLIILLLVTIVAIGSTRLSTTGQRISLNYQAKNSTFQAADSALASIRRDVESNPLASALASQPNGYGPPPEITDPNISGRQITTRTNTRRLGLLPGFGSNSGIPIYVYRTEATSTLDDMNISSELEEGFIRPSL
ncbi:PilX N-terminal domain-containing pilus assembly protein [Endozoicomonas sp. OPT23]|uniref:PilX N-terminal domain-containing pilus assembly protein n=1 Tax=Endozoicomonas sp. OPT23 TaxID=2072845 RepID=UPI001891E76F|nr:PilX N-terminal domain-containing pilus assembly protein [Endozoicomonas sp. OPT23]